MNVSRIIAAMFFSLFLASLFSGGPTPAKTYAVESSTLLPIEGRSSGPTHFAEAKKEINKTTKSFNVLRSIFGNKAITIFSKDHGPVEGVELVNLIELQGASFLELRNKKSNKTLLLRFENITMIRED